MFRTQYSNIENSEQGSAENSIEMVLVINGIRMGRIQGLDKSLNRPLTPVRELGTSRTIEFVAGISNFRGTIRSLTIVYGDLVKRLASASGGLIDADSKAATLLNMPEFEIQAFRRGTPQYGSPQLYAAPAPSQALAGTGGFVFGLIGCIIESFQSQITAENALIMENVGFQYIDEVFDPDKVQKFQVGQQLNL